MKAVFEKNREKEALVWKACSYDYGYLLEGIASWEARLASEEVSAGSVVLLEGDFSPNTLALFLALVQKACVIVPMIRNAANKVSLAQIAQAEIHVRVDGEDQVHISRTGCRVSHALILQLRGAGHAGLVLFSSGSTGESKAILHDLAALSQKFKKPGKAQRTISFLLYDHIGGVNTMLYTLANAGCLVTVEDRSPDGVLSAVENHRVELLPTSPTFLNLLLLSEAFQRHDLSSLKTITYGTEPMAESTLQRLVALFPQTRFLQTYGLSEVGILRSRSQRSDSLWVRLGGDEFQTRVVDGMLEIKAQSAMLGYLNAPSPFKPDGWFPTGDMVQVKGDEVKILGRKSEIINVGGQKVYPAEVEGVLQGMDNVAEVTVYAEKSAITGQIVCARVILLCPEDAKPFIARLRTYCQGKLEPFKTPVKVQLTEGKLHGNRFKKIRNPAQIS